MQEYLTKQNLSLFPFHENSSMEDHTRTVTRIAKFGYSLSQLVKKKSWQSIQMWVYGARLIRGIQYDEPMAECGTFLEIKTKNKKINPTQNSLDKVNLFLLSKTLKRNRNHIFFLNQEKIPRKVNVLNMYHIWSSWYYWIR